MKIIKTHLKFILVGVCFLALGCAGQKSPRQASSRPAGGIKPGNYEVFQEVVNKYVCKGLVKYRSLKENPSRLEEFLASLADMGPQSTPQCFSNPSQKLAFWINAFNAVGLRAGMERYPAKSVWSFWVNFEDTTKARIDGRWLSLSQIAQLARVEGNCDPRIDLALCLPAKGSGQFCGEVYLPETIDRQLDEGVHRAMKDQLLFQVDHKHWALRLGKPLFQYRKKYITLYEEKFHTENATIFNALGMYADSGQRSRLNSALGYRIEEIPFDWSLNVFDEPPCTLDNYK
jgi:hypothetical protein